MYVEEDEERKRDRQIKTGRQRRDRDDKKKELGWVGG